MRTFSIIIPSCFLLLVLPARPVRAAMGTDEWLERIDKAAPDVIIIGNSMQWRGLDCTILSRELGVTATDVSGAGAMSPWKYCALRYLIPLAKKQPKMIVIVTRMNFITSPQKRMGGKRYRSRINKIVPAGQDRQLLDALAFRGEGLPPWDTKWDVDELPPFDGYWWDFNKAVKKSFLPSMVLFAKQQGYKLVIARYKSRKYAEEPNWEPPQVKKYGEDLAAYLHANGVPFLDYVHHPALTKDLYAKGDHLDQETGKPVWTGLMAEDLKAILHGKPAPNQRLPRTVKPRKNNPTPTSKPASRPNATD